MPERIQRRRTKGWRMPAGSVYVGRPGPWGNPFKIDMVINRVALRFRGAQQVMEVRVEDAAHAVETYRQWLDGARLLRGGHELAPLPPTIAEIKQALRGRDLVCWCPTGQPCHADVLMELANA